ncbi:MAG TPA: FAD-dependent thymidylate synthase [Candidatus Portnoybacteria bacterium]|nr:FAD-dependent thymidylate synthase [Candidatus Portnoybacteria bacterium]
MISVKLVAATKLVGGQVESEFLALASHAALKCYQAKSPIIGEQIDVRKRLFETSHHTTLEHYSFTFDIEGIAVSDITLGAHLDNPFYNSDQRSGRFCAEMFVNPDFDMIQNYIKSLWPEISGPLLADVMGFVKNGVDIYQKNIEVATQIVGNLLVEERPLASVKYVEQNAPKIAQEQLRMFISTIFPTGFDFTLDHITLASLYKAAWSPGLIYLTEQMAKQVLAVYPELSYMFSRRNKAWSPIFTWNFNVKKKPGFVLRQIDDVDGVVIPEAEDMYPIDLLHFLPETMDNNVGGIKSEVEISLACMGQDQRHRTIRRSQPVFTGNFYLPPALMLIPELFTRARGILDFWSSFTHESCPATLIAAIAPYGAMVRYVKNGSFNAIFHEQNKRECFCAQEEIYHLGCFMRLAVEKEKGKDSPILQVLQPHCYQTGKCAEGPRYCGRDISVRESGNYFPERRV